MENKSEFKPQSCESGVRLWNKRDAAHYFGVTVRTIEIWMKSGRLGYFKIGRAVRFSSEDIRDQLKELYQVN
jgi:excisionase family DNA binding protein